ncbi:MULTISPECIES: GNAT family N-acetyltransferase [unclassified Leeuwenhoekiella]|uniref:GNAT family N-acetyltransferase n=1 Tax=unclassified Leeuwenhoekiella TaxID=2615029 RepID=UPI000C6AADE7|nr:MULTISPECIES: GNAT family N-acetyltransferase [unclassified Leeuwenhoekiella]MAW96199.1 N-acetyltransferase [Leeuwenhoekiella sp.]MBA80193.1 N-acetyltransferase [Leeuwenhoekiella sp.]|tara:strand:+ start:16412 stop:16903 length:492 start_codon:yes stop_codon:yes gene_type:complete
MNINIRPFKESDYPEVAVIYQQGIDTGIATFEVKAPDYGDWDLRFHKSCRLVAALNDQVIGWAALSPFSKRHVYRGVAEVTLYVSPLHQGKQVGFRLLSALIEASEDAGFWTLTAHIFPQNKVSLALHQKLGFRILGVHEKIAKRDGNWQDNTFLERRSSKIY